MVQVKIKGERYSQFFETEGEAVIRNFRSTEPKKPLGKKKKIIYFPDNKKGGAWHQKSDA